MEDVIEGVLDKNLSTFDASDKYLAVFTGLYRYITRSLESVNTQAKIFLLKAVYSYNVKETLN